MPGLTAVTLQGLQPIPVTVECAIQRGLPQVQIVGLPDAAVQESRERIRAAFAACGEPYPRGRVTVALSPAELRKSGASFDLPIAVAMLVAQGQLPTVAPTDAFLGELALDGEVRPVRGTVALALGLQRIGVRRCFVSSASAPLAARVPGLQVVPVRSLSELLNVLRTRSAPPCTQPPRAPDRSTTDSAGEQLDDLVGLEVPKRALLIAAAGGHHLLMAGPPGTGKSVLSRCLVDLLPPLSSAEQLDVNAVASLASSVGHQQWIDRPPLRAPHHSASAASLIGGGRLLPGDLSLAHRGVLFLDEFAEFRRDVIEQLRQPLEEGVVRLARADVRVAYPAQVQLVCATNPCPCGYRGDEHRPCRCTPAQADRYAARLSGPIADRIDLQVWVPRSSLAGAACTTLSSVPAKGSGEREHDRARVAVAEARRRQFERAQRLQLPASNAALSGVQVRRLVRPDRAGLQLLAQAETKLLLSPRAYVRVLKVAQTIADLAERDEVCAGDVAEALQFRVQASTR